MHFLCDDENDQCSPTRTHNSNTTWVCRSIYTLYLLYDSSLIISYAKINIQNCSLWTWLANYVQMVFRGKHVFCVVFLCCKRKLKNYGIKRIDNFGPATVIFSFDNRILRFLQILSLPACWPARSTAIVYLLEYSISSNMTRYSA